ncbi:E3 ubiquitin-protein ligase LRSAM1-like [Sinocyclocheilus rhinocerous]|uniref:E3 ubiquitin-protein ligase LRSAM1-like n=1 Tax=Sinocyclocheilus rhinocerous TaxID=307959 RepID=UPI0007B87B84|nr:PREDICTED: E3 ubiquitin-protein ligase LRSAM1-like [Sinocyclocheilus rhinocerous]
MFLFSKKKKPSEDSIKRLEYQLCLAKEAGADDILDISACELTEVPSSAFSICKVLQKKVLILHGNGLRSLVPKGCCIGALATLKVLDLHENKLTSLPDDIGQLLSLQVLNVEKNCIKQLPDSIGDLRNLQTLNVKENSLTVIPVSVGRMSSLRTLDISENSIRELPKELASVRTLESLILDAQVMSYPPASVCTAGTEEVQCYLCSEMGLEYCPPSQYLLPVLEHDRGKQEVDCVDGEEKAWQIKFMDYEKRKEQKQLEKLIFEKDFEEKQREHTQLFLLNNSRKEDVLLSVKLEQQRLELGVSQQQKAQETERLKILDKVRLAESNIMSRISDLLLDNKRQAKSAEFLQALEEDRTTLESLGPNSRQAGLIESACMQVPRFTDASARSRAAFSDSDLMLADCSGSNAGPFRVLSTVGRSHEGTEEMQKAAFEALQLQKDSVHAYIRNQIKLIEAELMQLTKLEVKRRNLDTENLQEVLADQRTVLTDLLQQLLKQKDQREEELRMVLVEMDQKSESNQQNYWMIQYQRLLDAKPLSLRMQEAAVDGDLGNLLCKLSAQHYLPVIAHHRITAEALRHMTTKDLRKLGINEVGVQKALLHWARERTLSDPFPKTAKEKQEAGPSTPSAPLQQQLTPPLTPNTPLTPTAPSPDRFSSSECVVCMEHESQVIFLPCGHVCCCQTCSNALQSCPLCRGSISQRVRLYHG